MKLFGRSWRRRTISASAVLFSLLTPVMAHHLDLRIWCIEPTPAPTCCELVSDSAGASATYQWWAQYGYGYIDPVITQVNYSTFHCYQAYSGRTETIYNQADNLYGHGWAGCLEMM